MHVCTKRHIYGNPGPCRRFEAKSSHFFFFFFASFNSLVVLTIHSDAYISRSGDFRADNDNKQTNQLFYPLGACARGNNIPAQAKADSAAQLLAERHVEAIYPEGK